MMNTNQFSNLQNPSVIRESWLTKQGHLVKNWKTRWFSLTADNQLHYFREQGVPRPIDSIPLGNCTVGPIDYPGRQFCFELYAPLKDKTYIIDCQNKEDLNAWLAAIQSRSDKSKTKESVSNKIPDVRTTWEISYEEIEWSNIRLGEGAHGTVHLASWRGADVAVKSLFAHIDDNEFRNEIKNLSRLQHPNIVQLVGYCSQNGTYYLVTEYLKGGSLEQLLERENRKIDPALSMRIAKDLCKGMICLHELKIMHRDLKPGNVLIASTDLTSPVIAKVGDFGISKEQQQNVENTTATGTISYMAPEVYSGTSYTTKVDVFSFGLIMWEMLSGKKPWESVKFKFEIVNSIKAGTMPEIPSNIPEGIRYVISDCWAVQPELRPTFSDILRRLEQVTDPRYLSLPLGSISVNLNASVSVKTVDHNPEPAVPYKPPPQPQPQPSSCSVEDRIMKFWDDKPSDCAVNWELFSKFLCELLKSDPIYAAPIRYHFFPDNLVRKDQWERFMKWFSPLRIEESIYEESSSENVPNHALHLSQVSEILRSEWFHGFIDSKEASERLRRTISGSYLIRFSGEDGNYVITLNDNGFIRQWKITRMNNFCFVIAPRNYQNLQNLIRTHQTEPLRSKTGGNAVLLTRACPAPPPPPLNPHEHYENVNQ